MRSDSDPPYHRGCPSPATQSQGGTLGSPTANPSYLRKPKQCPGAPRARRGQAGGPADTPRWRRPDLESAPIQERYIKGGTLWRTSGPDDRAARVRGGIIEMTFL